MKIDDKILIILMMVILLLLSGFNTMGMIQRPTREETIAIAESIIKVNSNTIFDKKNSSILEDCLLTLIEIEYNEIELTEAKRELKIQLQWLIDRNEQRIEELNDEFVD